MQLRGPGREPQAATPADDESKVVGPSETKVVEPDATKADPDAQ